MSLFATATVHSQLPSTRPCFVFEFGYYKTSDEVRKALERCHPKGTEATKLFDSLKTTLNHLPSSSPNIAGERNPLLVSKVTSLHPESKWSEIGKRDDLEQNARVTVALFARHVHVGNGNHNSIFANFILTPDERIHITWSGIRYFDQNYGLRKAPFNFRNVTLTKEQLRKVLLSEIGNDINRHSVDRLMTRTGAKFLQESKYKVRPGDVQQVFGRIYVFEDMELNNFWDRFVGMRNEFDIRIAWRFSTSGEFNELVIP